MDEQQLVKLYMELTGVPESGARSVLMYISLPDEAEPTGNQLNGVAGGAQAQPAGPASSPASIAVPKHAAARPMLSVTQLWLVFAALGLAAMPALAQHASARSVLPANPLSLAEAVNTALQQNPNVLRAQQDLEANQGIVIQTRAIAIPTLSIAGNYKAVQPGDIDTISIPGLPSGVTFGNDQTWSSQVRLTQNIYAGGRLLSSLRSARLLRQQALLNYEVTVSDTVLAVQLAYFDTLLAAQQIAVQQASVDLLTNQLVDARRRFAAGTVPRFNVLRAEVELANARPRLIRAENDYRIDKNNLANALGYNLPKGALEEIPLQLSGKLAAEPYKIDLSRAIRLALEDRPELGVLRKAQSLRREDVITAKAGYKPTLQAFAGYDVHNSIFSQDLTYENHGWMTGVQLSWNIFDGLLTRGRVKEAVARYQRARIDLQDEARQIELQVRTAHSSFVEAQQVLESEKQVVAEAKEALRLAQARYDAGTATQLDVLSAQTALTDARNTQAQALHDYMTARARLERAVGANLPGQAVR
jgi:outer membrane protein